VMCSSREIHEPQTLLDVQCSGTCQVMKCVDVSAPDKAQAFCRS
jgi:hypothetical protein